MEMSLNVYHKWNYNEKKKIKLSNTINYFIEAFPFYEMNYFYTGRATTKGLAY